MTLRFFVHVAVHSVQHALRAEGGEAFIEEHAGAAELRVVPITEGEHADVCRRGTLLLPVIEMAVSEGSSTIRVFFKNDEGVTVGDPIIRKIGNGTVKIAGTAGIEDPGIFAAYRTGNDTRWTVAVYEIPSGDIAKGEGRKLFEMEIPAERR